MPAGHPGPASRPASRRVAVLRRSVTQPTLVYTVSSHPSIEQTCLCHPFSAQSNTAISGCTHSVRAFRSSGPGLCRGAMVLAQQIIPLSRRIGRFRRARPARCISYCKDLLHGRPADVARLRHAQELGAEEPCAPTTGDFAAYQISLDLVSFYDILYQQSKQ